MYKKRTKKRLTVIYRLEARSPHGDRSSHEPAVRHVLLNALNGVLKVFEHEFVLAITGAYILSTTKDRVNTFCS